MPAAHRSATAPVATMIVASLAVLGGFGLLRLSANYESYLLLFVSFVLMVWGVVALFGRRQRVRAPHR